MATMALGDSWEAYSAKRFSVKYVRKLPYDLSAATVHFEYVCNRWLPLKMNVFARRLFLNWLPSKDALLTRNIQIASPLFLFCDESFETLD
ncbi:putative reverse transcriptase zinc-binding domain-containing protein [Helianthus annuus]|nr:putative reverse transcriptase zinc-binding domain-containing protein [Helianthus annuus]